MANQRPIGLRSGLRTAGWFGLALLIASLVGESDAQEPEALPDEPVLRMEAGGPSGPVMALAFAPDGRALYEGGWDKVARVWARDPQTGRFEADEAATYRVPIGPGSEGAVNAIALSQDGRWLAAAGNAVVRGGAGFRRAGLMIPAGALTDAMLRDRGTIFVFDTRSRPRSVRQLRGHLGPVLAMAFAPSAGDGPPVLASAAREGGAEDDAGALKLWDATSGEELDSIAVDSLNIPSLTAWRSGPGPGQVRVALSSDDGRLRLWAPDRAPGRLLDAADGRFNRPLAWDEGAARLVTGSFDADRNAGQLRFWGVADDGTPGDDRRLLLVPEGGDRGSFLIPRAISLIPSRPGGPADLAAVVVLRDPGQDAAAGQGMEYRLRIVDLNPAPGDVARVREEVRLWPFSPEPPSLAASPDGRHLAVSGNASRTIVVFEVADLLRGITRPQLLRGSGETIGDVAFVRKGDAWGLRLDPMPPGRIGDPLAPPRDGTLILDPSRRRLTAELDGWGASVPDAAGWDVRHSVGGRDEGGNRVDGWVEIRRGDGPARRITLRTGHTLTAVALRPPAPPLDVPIVAIASQQSGESSLALYEGESGERFRQLTGHAGKITALRFSGDGRLLASAADDQTVCVWSLIDAERTIGRRGRLPGVAITERDGRLVVAEVEPDSEAAGMMEEGDVVLGLVRDGRLDGTDSLFTLYNQISMARPGEVVTLRIAREGAPERDVGLRLGQAVDERKPLLSLFVTRDRGAEDRGWIAWNPLGPYDSSGQDVERLLGWHFNTGEPGAPTRFAQADQFLGFRREGLVGTLLERASLPPQAAIPPISPPRLALSLDVPEQEGGDLPLVRRAPSSLRLVLLDDVLAPEQVARVEWQVDDAPAGEMTPDGPRGWTARLDPMAWGRGTHVVGAVLHTREAIPQSFETSRQIRFLPPAPVVKIEGPAQQAVDRPGLTFRASVEPSGVPATVRLVHRVGGEVQAERSWRSGELITIAEPIRLGEGVNTIDLIAVNDDALDGIEAAETTDPIPVVVVYHRRQVPPPSIRWEEITPLDDGGDPEHPLPVGSSAVEVDGARILLAGSIESSEPIERVEWRRGEGDWQAVDPPPDAEGRFRVEATLEPGPNTMRVRAKSADSDFAEAMAEVSYRPRVGEVIDLTLEPIGPVLVVAPDQDLPTVRLSGRLALPPDPLPFEAEILLDGQPLPEPARIDAEAGTLSAEVPLRPGDNAIRVRLGNAWGASWVSEPVAVACRRPPKVLRVEHSEVGPEPIIDVTAEVASPPELPVNRVIIRVEGAESGRPARVIDDVTIEPGDDGRWAVSARRVPIGPGPNTIAVLAWNDDGQSPEPGQATGIVYEAPPPTPPRIAILRPGRDATERVDRIRVNFEVHSDDPLRSVRLIRVRTEAEHETLIEADPAEARREDGGGFTLVVDEEIDLEPRANLLRVEAVTEGGALATADVTVSYVPPPVRVVIDAIERKGRRGEPFRPAEGPDNRVAFPGPLDTGQGWLVGRVLWADEEALRRHEASRARIWVNRFPQSLARLRPVEGQPLVQEFRAEVVFSRPENEVAVELPGVPLDAVDRPAFRVACAAPEERQRMHLLVVGVGQADREALRSRALEALHAEPHPDAPDDPSRFQTPAFLDGVVYGPLHDDVRLMELVYQLDRIRQEVNSGLPLADRPIDVVVVYFQGSTWVEGEQAFLGLRRGKGRGRPESISLDFLADQFAETRGFQLFLLDAMRPIEAEATPITDVVGDYPPDRWPPSDHVHHVGIFDQTWWYDVSQQIPAQPEREATLSASLEQAVSQASELDDVATILQRGLELLQRRFENVTLDDHLPEPLTDLNLGRATGRAAPVGAID